MARRMRCNKGKWPTPQIARRPCWRIPLVGLLAVIFLFSLTRLTLYGIRAYQNQARQEGLSAQHEEALQQAQTSGTDTFTTIVPSAPKVEMAAVQAETPFIETSARKAFFKVIGLTQDSLKAFVKQNNDTVGWLTIEGLVDHPVLYRDNSYYLTHDFDRLHNACGALFVDENTPIHSNTQNLLIYGHNMKDGSMFGRLLKYTGNDYLRNHYTVQFDTRFENFTYIIFAVCQVSADGTNQKGLDFTGHASFADEAGFNAYIDKVYEQSLYSRYLDVKYSDTLLALVTCIDNDRLVLVARRQRDNETESDIRHCLLGLFTR